MRGTAHTGKYRNTPCRCSAWSRSPNLTNIWIQVPAVAPVLLQLLRRPPPRPSPYPLKFRLHSRYLQNPLHGPQTVQGGQVSSASTHRRRYHSCRLRRGIQLHAILNRPAHSQECRFAKPSPDNRFVPDYSVGHWDSHCHPGTRRCHRAERLCRLRLLTQTPPTPSMLWSRAGDCL